MIGTAVAMRPAVASAGMEKLGNNAEGYGLVRGDVRISGRVAFAESEILGQHGIQRLLGVHQAVVDPDGSTGFSRLLDELFDFIEVCLLQSPRVSLDLVLNVLQPDEARVVIKGGTPVHPLHDVK